MELPRLAPCADRSHPHLPDRWQATYLMAPFTKAQLTLGDFHYDGALPVLRIRLYGLRHGYLDLLIKGERTYLLEKDGTPAGRCLDLGDTGLRPPARDWLGPKAQCAATAPVAGKAADWWKTPSTAAPSANWLWYKKDDKSPFRLMFTQPEDAPAILGWYTFSYRVRFVNAASNDLAAIAQSCQPSAPSALGTGKAALRKLIDAMESASTTAEAELARLAPDIVASCPPAPLPGWPEKAGMTAIMTGPGFDSIPLSAEILYDWSRKSQRTRMYWPQGSKLVNEDALLFDGEGYSIERKTGGRLSCAGELPGTVRPNWPETGGCSCEAIIKENLALAPSGARIMVCPMTPPRVVWSWFAPEGQPLVFMETSAPGDPPAEVLTLVDYYSLTSELNWNSHAFQAPAQCLKSGMKTGTAPAAHRTTTPATRVCGACHLDRIPAPQTRQ